MEIKDRIKQKADELYRRYGVRSVTMDEIAFQLGVSKKTIYQCFSDKNELVDEVIGDILNLNRKFCINCHTKAHNAIHELFLAMINIETMFDNMNPTMLFDIERNHPVTFGKFSEFKYNFLFDIIKQNIERGKKEGLYREEMDADIIAKIRLECVLLPFSEKLFPQKQYPLSFLQKQLIEFFLFGMVTPKGYKLITKYKQQFQDDRKKLVVQ